MNIHLHEAVNKKHGENGWKVLTRENKRTQNMNILILISRNFFIRFSAFFRSG